MKLQLVRTLFGIFIATSLLTACEKDKEPEENQEEVITTMKLTFVPVGGGTTVTYQFKDPDGDGGAAPTQDEIVLVPSKTYNVTVQLLNETETPAEDITLEVQDEADAHRFYYQASGSSNIIVSALDNDLNGVPLGVTSTWTTGSVSNGTIVITLRHYGGNPPGKAAADPVDSPKSSTDIDVTFNTKIQ